MWRVDGVTDIIDVFAGLAVPALACGFSGDGFDARLATLEPLGALAIDHFDNVFFVTGRRVRRVDADTGTITTVAGDGTFGTSGEGVPATSTSLGLATGLSVDHSGNLFIADVLTSRVRRVDHSSGVINAVAGSAFVGGAGPEGVIANGSPLRFPQDVLVDRRGNLYIAEECRVRRVDFANGIIMTVAGSIYPTCSSFGDGGPARNSGFVYPLSLVLDDEENLFVVDGGLRIRRVTPSAFGAISGAGLQFGIAAQLSMGPVAIGMTSAPQALTVKNTGRVPLDIDGVTASGFGFTQTNDCTVLAPAEECTINIRFSPTASGLFLGLLVVSTDGIVSPPQIGLNGTGVSVPSRRISGSAYNSPENPTYRAIFSIDGRGPSSPSGSVQYYYARTRMNFVSTGVSEVSVTDSTFTIVGSGTVNGAGGYTFTVTAVDGTPDEFGILIRRPDGSVFYSAPPRALLGGAFKVSTP